MIVIPLWSCLIASVLGFAMLANEKYGEEHDKPGKLQAGIVFVALFGGVTNLFAHLQWYWAALVVLLCFGLGNWTSLFARRAIKRLSWFAPLAVIAGLVPQYASL